MTDSTVEAVARAIDPKAWEHRDADLARRDEWEREIKVAWGHATFEQWADRFIGMSLEQAHRVLAALSSPEREPMREALEAGTVSLTSFDGHCVRVDFASREDAEKMFELLTEAALAPPTAQSGDRT